VYNTVKGGNANTQFTWFRILLRVNKILMLTVFNIWMQEWLTQLSMLTS